MKHPVRVPSSLLTLALVVSPLAACGDNVPSDTPLETFANPVELAPDADGVRRLHFGPHEIGIDGRRFCLRTYNGSVPAPTIRVPASSSPRKVRIDLDNQFTVDDWRYIAGKEGATDAHCNNFNLTNLHFHGGHIRPDVSAPDSSAAADTCSGEGCSDDGRYFADNVLEHVEPRQKKQYRWDLDEDGVHHEGTQWYHPHIHGTTAIQVTNGSAGAFIVEGPLDALPEIARARERVIVMNQIPIDSELAWPLADGQTCNQGNLSVQNFLSITEYMPTLINGVRVPRLVTPPGQLERWRMVHAGNPDELGLKLHEALDPDCKAWNPLARTELVQIARDGITLPHFFRTDTLWMSPGYRADLLIQMPDSDTTLCLVERRARDLDGTAIAIIHVDARAGTATQTALPDEAAVTALAPPTTFRAKLGGQLQEVSCESTATRPPDQKVVLLVPETDSLDDDPIDKDLFAFSCSPDGNHHTPTGSEDDPSPLPGNQAVCQCPSPNINCRNFDGRRSFGYRADRVMTVDTAEKWEVTAFDGHPFHIHINPFLVCPTNSNKEPPFAHWRDTYWVQLEDGPRTFLTNFKTFAGRFVLHCHKLNHEDEGMMEIVEICRDGDLDCLCAEHDGTTCTIPMAGCYADDKQCQFAAVATASYPAPPPPTPDICGPGTPLPPFP
jgi:FtsP/CotA-like multicopper oxidase with cupredoxin domain